MPNTAEHTSFSRNFQWQKGKKNHGGNTRRCLLQGPAREARTPMKKGVRTSHPFKEPDTRHYRYRCFLSDLAGLAA